MLLPRAPGRLASSANGTCDPEAAGSRGDSVMGTGAHPPPPRAIVSTEIWHGERVRFNGLQSPDLAGEKQHRACVQAEAGRSVRACAHLSLTPDDLPALVSPVRSARRRRGRRRPHPADAQRRTPDSRNEQARSNLIALGEAAGGHSRPKIRVPHSVCGPSRPSSNGEHRRLRPRDQRRVAVSRETSPATG